MIPFDIKWPRHVHASSTVLALLLVLGCEADTGPTGINLTIAAPEVDSLGVEIDEYEVAAQVEDGEVETRDVDLSGRLGESTESVLLLFPPSHGGKSVAIEVHARHQGEARVDGRTVVTLKRGKIVNGQVILHVCQAADGPFCDGDVLVTCDAVTHETQWTDCGYGCNTGVGRCNACAVDAPEACDDGNPCTFDSCDAADGVCIHDIHALDGVGCDDGQACIVGETCSSGACQGGVINPCDDDNSCTDDVCDNVAGCSHSARPDNSPCNDGVFCSTGGDYCQGGLCQSGDIPACADGNPCTLDICHPEDGGYCVYQCQPAGVRCVSGLQEATCDDVCGWVDTEICAFGCNQNRQACNDCDPSEAIACALDIDLLCRAEIRCSPEGLVSGKTCCLSNRCTCDGSRCLEDACENGQDLRSGESYAGDTCSSSDNIPGDCAPGGEACLSPAEGGTPEDLFRFTLNDTTADATEFYDVTLQTTGSTLDTTVRVSTVCALETAQLAHAPVCAPTPGTAAELACFDQPGSGESLVLCGLPEGAFFAAVDGATGTCGSYDLDFDVAPVTLDDASEAGNISAGGVFTGNTCALTDGYAFNTTATMYDFTETCDGVSADCTLQSRYFYTCPQCTATAADCRVTTVESRCGHSGAGSSDAVFYLALSVDSDVDLSTEGSTFDTVLYISESGPSGPTPPGPLQLCNDDCTEVDGPSHIQTRLPAGLYYVALDGADGACGDFVLQVDVSPASVCPNLSCEPPFETCESCPSDCLCRRCGDGTVQPEDGESCDDAGRAAGDGCSDNCAVEPGYKCDGQPSSCVVHCGDGVLDTDFGEECDDGDTESGDGCRTDCVIESGFVCNEEPSRCFPGLRVAACPGVDIPDGDLTGVTTTLDVTDLLTVGTISVDMQITHSWIGDLHVKLTAPGGAEVYLHNRTGSNADDIVGNFDFSLTPDGPGALSDFVGEQAQGTWTLEMVDHTTPDKGVLECWALNITGPAVCPNSFCEVWGETCGSCPSDCNCPNCGDGVIDVGDGEECDDGDTQTGDGCSDRCAEEPAFECVSEPSICLPGVTLGACPALEVPDDSSAGVSHALVVPDALTIGEAELILQVSHPWPTQVEVDLTSPASTTVRLHDHTTNGLWGVFEQDLQSDGPGSMADFVGEASNGVWILRAADTTPGTTGTIGCWTLALLPAPVCTNGICEPQTDAPESCVSCPGDCPCSNCGDGIVQWHEGEECDDSATAAGDGCGSSCETEPDWVCSGQPSSCHRQLQAQSCPGVAIPDYPLPGVSDVVSVTSPCVVQDINVDLEIRHTYIGDLVVELSSPTGAVVTLHNRTGSSTDDIDTNYDLEELPDGPGWMSDFDGSEASGDWTLTATDVLGFFTGTLDCWGVTITCE